MSEPVSGIRLWTRASPTVAVRLASAATGIPARLVSTLHFHRDWPHAGCKVIQSMAAEGVYRSQFAAGISNGG